MARPSVGFVLLFAALIVGLALAPSSRANTSEDFATAFLSAPLAKSGTTFSPSARAITVSLPLWNNDYRWGEGHGYVGWDKSVDSPNAEGYLLETSYGDVPGLAIGLNGDMEYRPGGATWSYTAPGTTRIASAQMNLSYRNKMFAHHCLGVGLRNAGGNRDLVENCNPPEPDSQASYDVSLADPSSEPTAQEAFFNVRMPVCNNPADTPCSKWIPSLDLVKNGPLARLRKVEMVLVDDDLPVVTPSGPFYQLNGTYIDGRESYGLTVDASDAGAGIKRMDIDHLNNPQLANKGANCDPNHLTPALGSRIYPPEDQIDMIVDTNPMPEGTRRFDANATDPALNVGHAPWTVIIDRTPPPAPNLRFLKPEEGSAQVEWDAAQDPLLPDGTPGSQTTWYRYRSQIDGGAWTNWHEIAASRTISNEVYDQPIGTQVNFEVQAIDAVRNLSGISSIGGIVFGSLPSVAASDALALVNGNYYGNASAPLELGFRADDAGVGIRSMTLELLPGFSRDHSSECMPVNQPLAPGKLSCPSGDLHAIEVRPSDLSQGVYEVFGIASDRARNAARASLAVLNVDKSGPSPAHAFEIDFDDESSEAIITWEDGEDPEINDGVPGSGVSHSEFRTKRHVGTSNQSSWSAWGVAETDDVALPSSAVGEVVEIEFRTYDEVGNVSMVAATSLTVTVDSEAFVDFPTGTAADADLSISITINGNETVAGLPVQLENQAGERQVVLSDDEGIAHFSGLSAGRYRAKAVQAGDMDAEMKEFDFAPTSSQALTAQSVSSFNLALTSRSPDGPKDLLSCLGITLPSVCAAFYGDALRATFAGAVLFGRENDGVVVDDSRANAFKHAYAVTRFVRTLRTKFGRSDVSDAYRFARAHELDDRASSEIDLRRSSNMDTNNNLVGNAYAEDIRPKKNIRQLCDAMRAKSRKARYVGRLFQGSVDDISVTSGVHRTRLIYILSDRQSGHRLILARFFPRSQACTYALKRYDQVW